MANAVKAFIVKDGKLLIVKRSANDEQSPGGWEFPGGRLKKDEDPYIGLKREVKEETDLDISIVQVMDVQHFTRVDGQIIKTLIGYDQLLFKERTPRLIEQLHITIGWHFSSNLMCI